jgi:hypothetical protein
MTTLLTADGHFDKSGVIRQAHATHWTMAR